MMKRGVPPATVPTSVAQVSAAQAASAPIPTTDQSGIGDRRCAAAAALNTPPFANTCNASRSPDFSLIACALPAFRRALHHDNALAGRKNASSRNPHLHPAATVIAPTNVAATAPLGDKARRFLAPSATAPAKMAPAKALKSVSDSTVDLC
jgi:hypothetical protein